MRQTWISEVARNTSASLRAKRKYRLESCLRMIEVDSGIEMIGDEAGSVKRKYSCGSRKAKYAPTNDARGSM